MKKTYQAPELKLTAMMAQDVITASGGNKLPDEESPF